MYDPSMRVLTVLELLQARECVTGPELARRLEVSPRTVQRYVARLQDLGIPVESRRGVGGAYRLRAGFRLPPLMFGDDEALALALGLRTLRHLGLGAFAPAAEGAASKLERVLPAAVSAYLRDALEAVQLDAPSWTVETDPAGLMCLAAAVRGRQVVAFDYRSHAGEHSRREVEPYGLVHLDGRWYVVGRCRQRAAVRVFRLDRVSEVGLHHSRFERPDGFDARAHLHASLPFAQSRHQIRIWLDRPVDQVRPMVTPWRVALTEEAGGTRLTCAREHLDAFAAMLLGLDCELRVDEPEELREMFRQLAARASRAAGPPELSA